MTTRRRNSPRQARFLRSGVPAPKAMKAAWKRVPKNPKGKAAARVSIATRWCPTCQKHHIPIGNGGRHSSTNRPPTAGRRRLNPPAGGTEIYGRIKAIEAVKGNSSNYAGELFRHDFTKPARIYGMPDGSILIVGGR